jgi:hypothetical protein
MKSCRWLIGFLLLCLSAGRASAQQSDDSNDLIELSLGYGFGFPSASGLWLDTGSGGITQGAITDDLIKRVFIQRELAERIFLDLDYDSDRQGGFFYGDNVYSLQYQGLEDEFLQEISVGNRSLSIPGTRLISIDEGNAFSYALRTRMGTDRFRLQGLLRYSQSLSGSKRFRGSGRLVETESFDVSYVKRRFFFLPDRDIDETTLELYRSSEVPADCVIDGADYSLLVRGQDYRFDNTTGWIYLNRTLYEDEQLLAYYEKGGNAVGSGLPLGENAIIDESGSRADFNAGTFPEYFDGGNTYLYLGKKIERDDGNITSSFNSYWEIKSAYYLPEVYGGVVPEQIRIDLFLTDTGKRNENYDTLLAAENSSIVDLYYGALFFNFNDGTGFYPRPFPSEQPYDPASAPYTNPDPRNPFYEGHPIYGSIDDPEAADSVNTLQIRYVVDQDSYFLDFDIIEGSVRVTLDGQPLGAAYYTVDYYSGTIDFAEGVIGPTSDIEVTYRYSPLIGGNQELLLALGLDYDRQWLQLRNLTTFDYPIEQPTAPLLGQERGSVLANSTDVAISLGAPSGEQGWTAKIDAGAAVALSNSNSRKLAIVADMEEVGLGVYSGDVTTIEKTAEEAGADAFSLHYPEIYADLHGRESYRSDQGYAEQTLVCTLASDLAGEPAGESALLRRGFGSLSDLTRYNELRLFLFLTGAVPAEVAGFPLAIVGTTNDSLEITIDPAGVEDGWNEILVELDSPYRVLVNGAVVGEMSQPGLNPLYRVSEIRFGVQAGTGDVPAGFEFWLDEWHLAGSRTSVDVALYGETASGYRGELLPIGTELSLLTDPLLSAGFEHREGTLLDNSERRKDAWYTGFEAGLFKYVPVAVEVSGYDESAGRWLRGSSSALPAGLEDGESGRLYSHRIGIDAVLPFLPSLEHSYRRSTGEHSEVELAEIGGGETDYLLDIATTVGETLSFAEAFRYPEGLEQSYTFARNWLFADPDLTVAESHGGQLSYSWARNFVSLELGREESYDVQNGHMPGTVFAAYGQRLAGLFRPIYTDYPEADVTLALRRDRGELAVILPRRKVLGFTANLDSGFAEQNIRAASGNRDLTVENALSLSLPISPGGKGVLELTPGLSRAFSGSYASTAVDVTEWWLLGQSWKGLLMPPLYYLNPCPDQGRLHAYEPVDLLAGSSYLADRVEGLGAASFQTSLGLDLRLRDPPRYLPTRGSVELSGQTGREGQSYTQSRSASLGLGTDVFFKRGSNGQNSKNRANRFGLDTGWEGSWDYTYKLVSHTLFLDTDLDLLSGIRGTLSVDHTLTITTERQRIGDEGLMLLPGQPGGETAVPFEPDTNTVSSLLGLEYTREREIDPRRQELLAASRMLSGEVEGEIGRISHRDRLELENVFLSVLNAERTSMGSTTLVPLRLQYTHDTVMTVSEYMDLVLSVKTIGGVEEIISVDGTAYQPALGFELRLNAVLNF